MRISVACLVLTGLLLGLPALADSATTAVPDEALLVAPVVVDGKTLLRVRGISSYPAEVRAGRIRDRIISVAKDASIAPDSGRLESRDETIALMYGDQEIFVLVPADAT
ncbi:MAG: hypothetical protein V2I26_14150, partial [Halieaceae bacterium]|nr:hypothetical protein [Halieaceae bacterium]